jgi:hypothetical protein
MVYNPEDVILHLPEIQACNVKINFPGVVHKDMSFIQEPMLIIWVYAKTRIYLIAHCTL